MAPHDHPGPWLYCLGVCPAWWGVGGLHIPAGVGEGLFWLTRREESALHRLPRSAPQSSTCTQITWDLVKMQLKSVKMLIQNQQVWIGFEILHFQQGPR